MTHITYIHGTHVNYKIYLKYENKVISMSELRAWRSTLIPAGGKQRQEDLNSLEVRLGSTVSSRLPSYVGRLSLTNKRSGASPYREFANHLF